MSKQSEKHLEYPVLQRTKADLIDLMSMAKVAPAEVQPVVQCIHFAQQLGGDQLMLLELDDAVLMRLINGSDKIEVKGDADQEAVVCTRECTYELREVETSNSLLLSADMLLPPDTSKAPPQLLPGDSQEKSGASDLMIRRCDVSAVKQSYMELRRIRPSPGALRSLLEASRYAGLVEEAEYPERAAAALTLPELRRRVQASDVELDAMLSALGAVQLDGRVRLLQDDQPQQVLSALLAAAAENGWSLDALPADAVCTSVADLHDPRVARAVLLSHCIETADAGNDRDGAVALSPRLVSRSFGHFLLRLASAYKLAVFLQIWQDAVSDAATVSLDHLSGLCLLDDAAAESSATIRYFPADRLPDAPQLRFAELFKAKAKWTCEEVLPFLEGICFDKVTPGSLLTRYARLSTVNGRKFYSAR